MTEPSPLPAAERGSVGRSRFGPPGPVARRQVARTLLGLAALVATGAALALVAEPAPLRAMGLSLALPGSGFVLCHGSAGAPEAASWLGLATTWLMLPGAVFLWFATGNAAAPPAIWLLAALGSALYAAGHGCLGPAPPVAGVALLLLAGVLAGAGLTLWRRSSPSLDAAPARPAPETSIAMPPTPPADDPGELGPRDLARLRFLLDRALQPLDRFEGFERLDPFQSGALRYQLQFPGFALAMVQRAKLPALQGYLTQAQAHLIEKTRRHEVWRYWALENLWGRGRLDPDPLAVDNVMYSGFCAAQIALFQAASGDRRFSRPGAFTLHHPSGRRFEADFPSLVASISEQHRRSRFGLVACEPNWLFPVCNSISYLAIAAHEAQFGDTGWQDMAERQRTLLETEFTDRRGRFVTCRSGRTGLAMPPIGGALTRLLPCFFLDAALPDLARAHWQRLRPALLTSVEGSSRAEVRAFWPIDVGNYRLTRIAGLAGAAATATEMGDQEVASAMIEALDRLHPLATTQGIGHRPNASIWAHAFELIAQTGRADSLRDLVRHPSPPLGTAPTPHVSDCPYPQALVTRAVWRDGRLELVLVPGTGGGRITLGLAGLKPHGRYRRIEDGAPIASGQDGTAALSLDLRGRTVVTMIETESD